MDQLWHFYNNEIGGAPINKTFGRYRFFLPADEDVLEAFARGEGWIKCAHMDYDPVNYVLGGIATSSSSLLWLN